MKAIFFQVLILVVVINCETNSGLTKFGNYGTRFATRKTYYFSFELLVIQIK